MAPAVVSAGSDSDVNALPLNVVAPATEVSPARPVASVSAALAVTPRPELPTVATLLSAFRFARPVPLRVSRVGFTSIGIDSVVSAGTMVRLRPPLDQTG